MKIRSYPCITSLFFIIMAASCKEMYNPPASSSAKNSFLVVDGIINASPEGITSIQLSRAQKLGDSIIANPERKALLMIEAESGASHALAEKTAGYYESDKLNLSVNGRYRLLIATGNGDKYVSDFVPVKITPPIDSINFIQDNDVTIYANTHDPLNNTHYYRWDYTETWSYNSILQTYLGVGSGLIFYRDSTNQIQQCWRIFNAADIILGNSLRLNSDEIHMAPVKKIIHDDERLWVRYSMLLRQYALTETAYMFWNILQKNSQQLGSLFDAQPSQLKSNIHNTQNSAEPVIGYLSVCTVQEKRIFINHNEIRNWISNIVGENCAETHIPKDPGNYLLYHYPDTTFAPYYFTSGGEVVVAKKYCLDCTLRGGSDVKPSFW